MKNLKNEQGSVTLFVLIAMLFIIVYLVSLYIISSNSETETIAQTGRIKEIYEKNIDNIDSVYETLTNYPTAGTVIETKENITYVADGKNNKNPIPDGFRYLEGSIQEGLVIVDTTKQINETGETINTLTTGNEFVWIPVDIESYNRIDYGKNLGTYSIYEDNLDSIEEESIKKYGGFYIGRYETAVDGDERTEQSIGNVTAQPIIKQNKNVYNYITRADAITKSNELYTTSTSIITSKLCSGYAWDATIEYIKKNNEELIQNSLNGNYSGSLYKTGKTTPMNNIYDMAGNVWEYTTENYQTYVGDRGGAFLEQYNSTDNPISCRSYADTNTTDNYHGFRVTLFIK